MQEDCNLPLTYLVSLGDGHLFSSKESYACLLSDNIKQWLWNFELQVRHNSKIVTIDVSSTS